MPFSRAVTVRSLPPLWVMSHVAGSMGAFSTVVTRLLGFSTLTLMESSNNGLELPTKVCPSATAVMIPRLSTVQMPSSAEVQSTTEGSTLSKP